LDAAIISAVVAILVALLTNRNNVTKSSSTNVSNQRSTWRASLKEITDKCSVLCDGDYATILSNVNTYNITDKNARAYFLHDNHIKDLIEIPNHSDEKSEIIKVFLRYLLKFDWERSKAEIRQVSVETAKADYIAELKEFYKHGKYLTDKSNQFLKKRLIVKYNESVGDEEAIKITDPKNTDTSVPEFSKETHPKNNEVTKTENYSSSEPRPKQKAIPKENPENEKVILISSLYSVLIGTLLVMPSHL